MTNIGWNKYIEKWSKSAAEPSGNYTSNLPLDQELLNVLMENHIPMEHFNNTLNINDIRFPNIDKNAKLVQGLNILAGLQNLSKPDCISVYRAIRFPTPKRLIKIATSTGISTLNYEHQRLLKIYEDPDYKAKRENLRKDPRFCFQPQERIVPGLPVFFNVNDAIHIHRAYRNENDLIVIAVAYIPNKLISNDKIEIFSNFALVQNYSDSDGDRKIKYFKSLPNGRIIPFFKALNIEGNLVYETYCKGIPQTLEDSLEQGIEQQFYLLELYKPKIDAHDKSINGINLSKELASNNSYFLYGFWGDDNIFMRRTSEFLPKKCFEITLKSNGE